LRQVDELDRMKYSQELLVLVEDMNLVHFEKGRVQDWLFRL
jgi:hypothetical protein